jgi:anti-sigma regulatory factor (Ser/Thr protein kinase)
MNIFRITLDSRPEETDRLLDWLEPVLSDSGLDPSGAFGVRCAIVELVNNAILHAYGSRPGFPIDVRVELADDRVVAEVRDRGPHFDGPASSGPADLMSESGRGFDIIEAFVDCLAFLKDGDWNVCRVIKHH